MNILDTFIGKTANPDRVAKVYGVVVGIVTNNVDPEGLGRVKVKFPWLSDEDESNWARVATFMAGTERGAFFLPEVDDEVLIAFEHGNINTPYVVGSLWNGKDKPILNNEDEKNNLRQFTSRSGHKLIFDDNSEESKEKVTLKTALGHSLEMDDTDGKGKISLSTTAGHTLTLDDENEKVVLDELNGNNITIDDQGVIVTDLNDNVITMKSSGLVLQDANGNSLEMSSDGISITDASGNTITMDASGIVLEASGKNVSISPGGVGINNNAFTVS